MQPTTEQLQHLTDLINTRYAEFTTGTVPQFEPMSLGHVRLIMCAVEEWQEEREPASWAQARVCATPSGANMNGTVPDSFAVDELDDLEDDGLGSIDLDDADPAPAKTKPGPKGAPTAARRAQLARLREERAGHRKGGVIESEAQRHAHRSNVVPSLAEVVAEVQRISMAGAMPTMAQFDESKPAVWASAAAHLQRLKLSWPQLADTAGLKPRGNRAAP